MVVLMMMMMMLMMMIHLSNYPLTLASIFHIHLSIYLSIYLSISILSIYLSIYIYLFYTYLSDLSIYLSICPIGYCYQKGVGVARDEAEAVRLYLLAGMRFVCADCVCRADNYDCELIQTRVYNELIENTFCRR